MIMILSIADHIVCIFFFESIFSISTEIVGSSIKIRLISAISFVLSLLAIFGMDHISIIIDSYSSI
jgi:hypothetical protein